MGEEKIQISWDELKTSKVEKHIRQQQAVARNRRYSQMTPDDLPVGQGSSSLLWYNPIFFLAAFGLLGGLLAWAGGAVIHLAPDRQGQADQSLVAIQDIRKLIRTSDGDGGITPAQANDAIRNIVANSGNNAYLAIDMDDSLSSHEKQQRLDALRQYDYSRNLITNILGFGLCGLFISIGLSVAEPVVDKNMHAVIVNGSVGAGLGLLGGLGASLVVDRIYRIIGGAEHGMLRQYVAQCASWAVLGSFVRAGAGSRGEESQAAVHRAGRRRGGRRDRRDIAGAAVATYGEPGIRAACSDVLHRGHYRSGDGDYRKHQPDRVVESHRGTDRWKAIHSLSKPDVHRLGTRLPDFSLSRSEGRAASCGDSSGKGADRN